MDVTVFVVDWLKEIPEFARPMVGPVGIASNIHQNPQRSGAPKNQ